jgi:hypothetical protein
MFLLILMAEVLGFSLMGLLCLSAIYYVIGSIVEHFSPSHSEANFALRRHLALEERVSILEKRKK